MISESVPEHAPRKGCLPAFNAALPARFIPMEVLSTLAEVIRDLFIFVAVMTGMLVVLVVAVSKMADSNPLKRLLTALTYRVGATAAAGAFAIPIEPIPGIDAMYDIAVPALLFWYWLTFFRDAFFRGSLHHTPPGLPPRRRPGGW
jgi:hypothetical protein